MNDVKEKLQRFNKDILEDINSERKAMLEQAYKELNDYYLKTEKEYVIEANESINNAIREIKRRNQIKRSKIIMEHKMTLLEKRNAIIEKIYFEATKKLINFSKTEDYKEFLIKKLNRIKRVIGDDLEVTLSYRDRELKDFIEEHGKVRVIIANKKRELIGGLICHNEKKGILVDESFAKTLADKKEEILRICNLQVD